MGWLSDATGINIDLPNKNVNIDPGKAITGGLGGIYGNMINAGRSIIDHQPGPGTEPTPPPGDDRLAQIRADQQKQADEFSKNAPGLKNQIYSDVQNTARQGLARDIASSNQNYNNRGLLFSGMRQGTDLGLKSQESQNLAKARTGINTSIDAQAKQMQYNAIDSGLQAQKSQQAIQDEIYGNTLAQFSNRNAGLNAIGGGAGQIGGAYFASRGQNQSGR